MQFPDALSAISYVPKNKWEHLIAPNMEHRAFLATDNTHALMSEERGELTSAYQTLKRWNGK